MIHSLFDDAPEQSDETSEQGADEKKGFFRRLVTGLSKTRKNLNEGFDRLIGSHTKLDEEFMEELEELLFSADVGVDITMRIVSDLRADVKKNLLKNTSEVIGFIKKELIEILNRDMEQTAPVSTDKPFVILVIGVNGSGKTTTVGKLAAKLNAKGHSVLLAAGDTFRAAAIDQLEEWAKRANADLVRHQAGSDPSAVVFDAYKAAVSRGRDVMIADTAGRLHNKVSLMEELKKIKRIIGRQAEGAPHETLLALDATTGQNALNQVEIFGKRAGVTGLVMTKLDGTARGGILVAIAKKHDIPVHFIGIGEDVDDLEPFKAADFAAAIAGKEYAGIKKA